VDADGQLVDAAGRGQPRVSVLGPARRGRRYWETTAVPEIRAQAADLAGLVESVRVPPVI
jgi:uncharacterized NAD(P)/FAD-binding protein YdhS